jgi:hypothetical protein
VGGGGRAPLSRRSRPAGQFHPGSYLFVDGRSSGMQVLAWKAREGVPWCRRPPHEMTVVPHGPTAGSGSCLSSKLAARSWAVRTLRPTWRTFPTVSRECALVRWPRSTQACTPLPRTGLRDWRSTERELLVDLGAAGCPRSGDSRLRVQPPGAYRRGRPCRTPRSDGRWYGSARKGAWWRWTASTVRQGPRGARCDSRRASSPPRTSVLRFDHRGLRGQVRFLLAGHRGRRR